MCFFLSEQDIPFGYGDAYDCGYKDPPFRILTTAGFGYGWGGTGGDLSEGTSSGKQYISSIYKLFGGANWFLCLEDEKMPAKCMLFG